MYELKVQLSSEINAKVDLKAFSLDYTINYLVFMMRRLLATTDDV